MVVASSLASPAALLTAACLAGVGVPIIGVPLLAHTYRTDRYLVSVPVPVVRIPVAASAALCCVIIATGLPAAGVGAWSSIAVAVFLGTAFLTDAAGRVIPDLLNLAGGGVGIALGITGHGLPIESQIIAFAGMAIGVVTIRKLLVARLGADALCLGDVKLLLASSLLLPFELVALGVIGAAVAAVATVCVPRERQTRELPFGTLFAIGVAMTAALVANEPISIF